MKLNHKKSVVIVGLVFAFCSAGRVLAQTAPVEQGAAGQERMRQLQEAEEKLRQRVKQPKPMPQIEEEKAPEVAPALQAAQKVLIQKINVTGVTLLKEAEITKITAAFENKELTVAEMQKAADLITDAYRKRGYITSRAYLPPQKLDAGILEIRVVEGVMGDVDIRGNRYFKSSLLRKRVALKKGEPFNYNKLRENLTKINQYPDRNARAVLAPGKEPATTDVVLEVKDRLPVHMDLNWDNFGSRYVEKNRYQATLTHNNLLGFDDMLTFQYQIAEADTYRLTSVRYLFPYSDSTQIGFYTTSTQTQLGREFKDLDARGKSHSYGVYANQNLISSENVNVGVNVGFDYKDVFNFQLENETSRDRLRVAKLGFDSDFTDNHGRTVLTNEFDVGIPGIMGALKEQDGRATRSGSGGSFTKDTINLLRLQKMPFSSTLLLKNQIQFSPSILTATEQFQLGGVANVRGYPPAELVGDGGYTTTAEWSIPPYFLSKNLKTPFAKASIYDALRFVAFYDWGNVRLRRPQAGEEKTKTLRSAGCGVRFSLPQNFSFRADLAWPLDNFPSDGNRMHPWFQFTKEF